MEGHFTDKCNKTLLKVCDILEIIFSVFVGLGIVATVVTFILPQTLNLFSTQTTTEEFMAYLSIIFNVVIGLEFMKMLCKPNSDNVIEVLEFLVARHMIMEDHTAQDMFLSILSICLLFLLRRLLHIIKYKGFKVDLRKELKTENEESVQERTETSENK